MINPYQHDTAKWFIDFDAARRWFEKQSVVIVGSAPSVLKNKPGFIDSHDVVVRVNNYKLLNATGHRVDVHYSYYGNAIRKTPDELWKDGVQLCMCKCPDGKPIESEWHERNRKQAGIDFRYIYTLRRNFWFCPTFVPTKEHFLIAFELLDRHIPTTGFSAIHDVLQLAPRSLHLTGFDFFTSGLHNVDEPWQRGRDDDPIRHMPQRELNFIRGWMRAGLLTVDDHMKNLMGVG